jgi:hypothetical protein
MQYHIQPVAAGGQPVAMEQTEALQRWRLGHQVFFAMIQSLIVLMSCAIDAFENEELLVNEIIDTAAIVMRGSAAALHFAGGFSSRSYAETVRPAMMPPHLEDKFSGLQSRDHRYLLVVLGRVKKLVRATESGDLPSYRRFLSEVDATYHAHKHVCSRFGGDNEPSLRMSGDSGGSAVEVLERLRIARLRQIGA